MVRSTVRDQRVVRFYGNQLNKARTLRANVTWPGVAARQSSARIFEKQKKMNKRNKGCGT